jgi:PIN domain nuclease of toxin-antitoxin system
VRVLLDTHAFLWWAGDMPQLSARARRVIASSENECFMSVATYLEIAIKASLGKLEISGSLERFIPHHMTANGFRELPAEVRHAARLARLPFHHRDPFDRLLASQALEEGLAVVSRDPIFRKYGVKQIW